LGDGVAEEPMTPSAGISARSDKGFEIANKHRSHVSERRGVEKKRKQAGAWLCERRPTRAMRFPGPSWDLYYEAGLGLRTRPRPAISGTSGRHAGSSRRANNLGVLYHDGNGSLKNLVTPTWLTRWRRQGPKAAATAKLALETANAVPRADGGDLQKAKARREEP